MDFPKAFRYRYITIPLDPLQRPKPKDDQIAKIKDKIKELQPKNLDQLFNGIRDSLDLHIPAFPQYKTIKKKIFRVPLPKKVVAEIIKKKRLFKFRKGSNDKWNKFKKQRNKVADLVRDNKTIIVTIKSKSIKMTRIKFITKLID